MIRKLPGIYSQLIGYSVYKVNAVNTGTVKKELLQQNIMKVKHIFASLLVRHNIFQPPKHMFKKFAVINLIVPEIGKLVLKKHVMIRAL